VASQPPQAPETLILSSFDGVKNTVTPERLKTTDLEAAVNVDIDDEGQLHRRRGYVLMNDQRCHSLKTLGGYTFCAAQGILFRLQEDWALNLIYDFNEGTNGPVSITMVGDTFYASDGAQSIKFWYMPSHQNARPSGFAVDQWGAAVATWLSPVISPTDTLGAIGGKLLGPPPTATLLEYYRGRIYMVHGSTLWTTDLYLYDHVDKTRNFLQFEHDITMLAAADDGLYVGTTEKLYFLHGVFSEGMKRDIVMDTGVVKGSCVPLPASRVHPQARQGNPVPEAGAFMFLTNDGVCAAFDGGEVYNLTRNRVVFPGAIASAAMVRDLDGFMSYVVTADAGGSPSSTARIGDYIDAEIVRFRPAVATPPATHVNAILRTDGSYLLRADGSAILRA